MDKTGRLWAGPVRIQAPLAFSDLLLTRQKMVLLVRAVVKILAAFLNPTCSGN